MLLWSQLWEGNLVFLYLLSDHVGVVARLDFEGAVVRPQVDRVGDAGDSSLVDLALLSRVLCCLVSTLPIPPPPSPQWKIPDPHTSSSTRKVGEI